MAPSRYEGEISKGDNRYLHQYPEYQQYTKMSFDDKEILIGSFVTLKDTFNIERTSDRKWLGRPKHAQIYRILKSRQGALILVILYYTLNKRIERLPCSGTDDDYLPLSKWDVFVEARTDTKYVVISREDIATVTSMVNVNFKENPAAMIKETKTQFCCRFLIQKAAGKSWLRPNTRPTKLEGNIFSNEKLKSSMLNSVAEQAQPMPSTSKQVEDDYASKAKKASSNLEPKPSTSKHVEQDDAPVATIPTSKRNLTRKDDEANDSSSSVDDGPKKKPLGTNEKPKTKEPTKAKPDHPALISPPKRKMFKHPGTMDDSLDDVFVDDDEISQTNNQKQTKTEEEWFNRQLKNKKSGELATRSKTGPEIKGSNQEPLKKSRTVLNRALEVESDEDDTQPFAVSKTATQEAKKAAQKKKQDEILADSKDVFAFQHTEPSHDQPRTGSEKGTDEESEDTPSKTDTFQTKKSLVKSQVSNIKTSDKQNIKCSGKISKTSWLGETSTDDDGEEKNLDGKGKTKAVNKEKKPKNSASGEDIEDECLPHSPNVSKQSDQGSKKQKFATPSKSRKSEDDSSDDDLKILAAKKSDHPQRKTTSLKPKPENLEYSSNSDSEHSNISNSQIKVKRLSKVVSKMVKTRSQQLKTGYRDDDTLPTAAEFERLLEKKVRPRRETTRTSLKRPGRSPAKVAGFSSNPEGTKVPYKRNEAAKIHLTSNSSSEDEDIFKTKLTRKRPVKPNTQKAGINFGLSSENSSDSSDSLIINLKSKQTSKRTQADSSKKSKKQKIETRSRTLLVEDTDSMEGFSKELNKLKCHIVSQNGKQSTDVKPNAQSAKRLLDLLQGTKSDKGEPRTPAEEEKTEMDTEEIIAEVVELGPALKKKTSVKKEPVEKPKTFLYVPVIRPEGAPIGSAVEMKILPETSAGEDGEFANPLAIPRLLTETMQNNKPDTSSNEVSPISRNNFVVNMFSVMGSFFNPKKVANEKHSTPINIAVLDKENVETGDGDDQSVPNLLDCNFHVEDAETRNKPEEQHAMPETLLNDNEEQVSAQGMANANVDQPFIDNDQENVGKNEDVEMAALTVEAQNERKTRPLCNEPTAADSNNTCKQPTESSGGQKRDGEDLPTVSDDNSNASTPKKKKRQCDDYNQMDFMPQRTTRSSEKRNSAKNVVLSEFMKKFESNKHLKRTTRQSNLASPLDEIERVNTQCSRFLFSDEVTRAGDKEEVTEPGTSKEVPIEEKTYKVSESKGLFKRLSITLKRINDDEHTGSEVEDSDIEDVVAPKRVLPAILRPKKNDPSSPEELTPLPISLPSSPLVFGKKPRKERPIAMSDDQIQINGRKSAALILTSPKPSTSKTLVASPAKDGSLRMRIRSPDKQSMQSSLQEKLAAVKSPEKKVEAMSPKKEGSSRKSSVGTDSPAQKEKDLPTPGKQRKSARLHSSDNTTPERRGRLPRKVNTPSKETPKKVTPKKETPKKDTPKIKTPMKETPSRGRRSLQLSTPTKSPARRRISVAPRMETVDEEISSKRGLVAEVPKTPENKSTRSRPRRAITPLKFVDLSDDEEEEVTPKFKKRGRPPLKKVDSSDGEEEEVTPKPKRRGRPAFKTTIETPRVGRPSKSKKETPNKNSTVATPGRTPRRQRKLAVEESDIEEQKMPGREEQMANIQDFIESRIEDNSGGCMYISGLPGTGKTASVNQVLRNLLKMRENKECNFKLIQVSGMELTQPQQVFCRMADILLESKLTPAVAQASLTKFFSNKDKKRATTILVIDELDMLCTKKQDVIYHLFDWPTKASAKLIVLTIANTMDLPERLLQGKVTSRMGLTRLTFRPYTFDQLEKIVHVKLGEVGEFDRDARQLVARKVASLSGDARRALDICRRALEVVAEEKGGAVEIEHVTKALEEMLESPNVEAIKNLSPLEKLFLECMASEIQRTGVEETTLGEVLKSMRASGIYHGVTDFTNSKVYEICARLASSRLVLAEQDRAGVKQRISLNVNTDDLHYALKVSGQI